MLILISVKRLKIIKPLLPFDEINYDALRTEDVEKIKLLENLLQSIRRVTTDVTNIYVYSTEDARAAYSSTFAFDKSQLGKQMTLTPMIPALNGVFCETTNQPIALVIKPPASILLLLV